MVNEKFSINIVVHHSSHVTKKIKCYNILLCRSVCQSIGILNLVLAITEKLLDLGPSNLMEH